MQSVNICLSYKSIFAEIIINYGSAIGVSYDKREDKKKCQIFRNARGYVELTIPDVKHWDDGPLLTRVEVQVIFWGKFWVQNQGFRGVVNNAVHAILTGPYMTELQQYGDIQKGKLSGPPTDISKAVGNSPADPPPTFKRVDIQNLISNLIQSEMVSDPGSSDQLLYSVFLPPGCTYEDSGTVGDHNCFVDTNSGRIIYFAWVSNDGSLDSRYCASNIFSHELVEACTDPNPANPGYTHLGTNKNGKLVYDEIADNCEKQYSTVNGVTMQYYWSQRHKKCILPL